MDKLELYADVVTGRPIPTHRVGAGVLPRIGRAGRAGAVMAVAACLSATAGCRPASQDATPVAARPCLSAGAPDAAASGRTARMTLIPAGEFLQGAAPARPEEGPPRRTRVAAFWIDRTEVTNAEFARFVAATGYVTLAERPLDPRRYPQLSGDQLKPSSIVFGGQTSAPDGWWRVVQGADWRHPRGPDSSLEGADHLPVVHVAWEDAMAYARWLGRDLPTEAEWEYAARGGLQAKPYVWGDERLDPEKPQANVWQGPFPAVDAGADGYKARLAPVGCFAPNGFGLHDMAGNVWEWTRDWYAPGLDASDTTDPIGPSERAAYDPDEPEARKHVIKGGSYLCADNFCFRYRPPARQAGPTDTGSDHVGFRTVLRVSATDASSGGDRPGARRATPPASP